MANGIEAFRKSFTNRGEARKETEKKRKRREALAKEREGLEELAVRTGQKREKRKRLFFKD